MNPFHLTGFSFLAFYLATGVLITWGLRYAIRRSETRAPPPAQNMTDPYLIAHLRGGEKEALRVVTVALLDRGLLVAEGDKVRAVNGQAVELVRRPIEKAVLRCFRSAGDAIGVFKDEATGKACNDYAKVLADQGMVADAGVYASRLLPTMIALSALVAIAAVKIQIALSQGRHNIGFLIVLAILFGIVTVVIWRKRLTGRGEAMLADLRDLFARLKGRARTMRAGGQTNEATMLAAVFGLAALPAANFPFLERLYPAKSGDGGGGCGSSSSCSSSGCSGGCGGGGCGG